MAQHRSRSTVAVLSVLCGCLVALPASAADDPVASKQKAWDADQNGAIDRAEARKAGEAKFGELDKDADRALDAQEAAGVRITKPALAQIDADHNGKLSTAEYLTLLEERFQAADADRDGKVTAPELKSQAAQALMTMLK